MQLREIDEQGYRIFIGALESPRGDGFTAAVAIHRRDAPRGAAALYRDDQIACGHRWATAEDALRFALRKARAWLRAQPAGVGRAPPHEAASR